MKKALTVVVVSTGAFLIFAVMFLAALAETMLRGNKVLDFGLDEDAT